MLPAIVAYAVVAWAVLYGLDQLWPIWPVHAVAFTFGLVVMALALLMAFATRR